MSVPVCMLLSSMLLLVLALSWPALMPFVTNPAQTWERQFGFLVLGPELPLTLSMSWSKADRISLSWMDPIESRNPTPRPPLRLKLASNIPKLDCGRAGVGRG